MLIASSDINSKVIDYSGVLIDKVVRVFTGTYTSSDLISRAGGFGNIYMHRIAHGLTRPVLCDLMWSNENGIWLDSGCYDMYSNSRLAFSDDTYIYIFHGFSTADTPVQYKIYCAWIDNYDTTNPSVETRRYSNIPIQYDARSNYQKIHTFQQLLIPAGQYGSVNTQYLYHDIATTPNAKAWFEPFAGEVWPINAGGNTNVFFYDENQDEATLEITNSSVRLDVTRFSNVDRRAWVKIYYDGN